MLTRATFFDLIRNYSTKGQTQKIKVPREQLELDYVRSSGPGGQNVNKRSTKAKIRFNPLQATWMPEDVKTKFIELNKTKLTLTGDMILSCQKYRTQPENEKSCINSLQRLVDDACLVAAGGVSKTEAKIRKIQKSKAKLRSRALKKTGSSSSVNASHDSDLFPEL